jgi:hypothetical protein
MAGSGCPAPRFRRRIADHQHAPATTAMEQADQEVE